MSHTAEQYALLHQTLPDNVRCDVELSPIEFRKFDENCQKRRAVPECALRLLWSYWTVPRCRQHLRCDFLQPPTLNEPEVLGTLSDILGTRLKVCPWPTKPTIISVEAAIKAANDAILSLNLTRQQFLRAHAQGAWPEIPLWAGYFLDANLLTLPWQAQTEIRLFTFYLKTHTKLLRQCHKLVTRSAT